MSRHRIFKSEAFEPKPIAYMRMAPRGRRGAMGYLVAALVGALLVMAGIAVLALVQHGLRI